jgi:hypothetical protein
VVEVVKLADLIPYALIVAAGFIFASWLGQQTVQLLGRLPL